MKVNYDVSPSPALSFSGAAVSAASIWQVQTDTFHCKGPTPGCIFVQLWSGAELCGLAKLVLEPFEKESVQEMMSLQGYKKIFEGELEVFAVINDVVIGKLQVCAHAGLAPVLLALQDQFLQDSRDTPLDPQEITSALLLLSCEEDICNSVQGTALEEMPKPKQLTEALRTLQPLLTSAEASAVVSAVVCSMKTADPSNGVPLVETPTFLEQLQQLRARIIAVQESFDQMIEEIGDEAGSVALDFLEVGNSARLQRQDVARTLKFRGLDLSWGRLEGVFLAIGCPDPLDAVPAEKFARLFRRRSEHVKLRQAQLRQLETKVLARLRQGQARHQLEELVWRYSKADDTIDHLGLALLLGADGSFPRQDVDDLALQLFERFRSKGGSVSSIRVIQWLVGSPPTQSSLRDVDLNVASQKPKQLLAQLAAKLPKVQPQVQAPDALLPKDAPAAKLPSKPEASTPFHDCTPLPEKIPVQEGPTRATLQLARPLRGSLERTLTEVMQTSLDLEPARLLVIDTFAYRDCSLMWGFAWVQDSRSNVAMY